MTIGIRFSGPDAGAELSSLCGWLCDERDVRRHAQIALRPAKAGPPEMGMTFDVIYPGRS